jgi:hypothetical protein
MSSRLAFWRTVVQDRSDFVGGVFRVLEVFPDLAEHVPSDIRERLFR